MKRTLLALVTLVVLAFSSCSSIPPLHGDIIIQAKTPLVLQGKSNTDKTTCAFAVEYDGKTVVFWSEFGCGVVHREVIVPVYHDEEFGEPR